MQYWSSNNKVFNEIAFAGNNCGFTGAVHFHPSMTRITFLKKQSVITNIMIPDAVENENINNDEKSFIVPHDPKIVEIYLPNGSEFGNLSIEGRIIIHLMHKNNKDIHLSFNEIENPRHKLWHSDKVHITKNEYCICKKKYLRNINIKCYSNDSCSNNDKKQCINKIEQYIPPISLKDNITSALKSNYINPILRNISKLKLVVGDEEKGTGILSNIKTINDKIGDTTGKDPLQNQINIINEEVIGEDDETGLRKRIKTIEDNIGTMNEGDGDLQSQINTINITITNNTIDITNLNKAICGNETLSYSNAKDINTRLGDLEEINWDNKVSQLLSSNTSFKTAIINLIKEATTKTANVTINCTVYVSVSDVSNANKPITQQYTITDSNSSALNDKNLTWNNYWKTNENDITKNSDITLFNSNEILGKLKETSYTDENVEPNIKYIFKDVNITPKYYALPGKKYEQNLAYNMMMQPEILFFIAIFCPYCYFASNTKIVCDMIGLEFQMKSGASCDDMSNKGNVHNSYEFKWRLGNSSRSYNCKTCQKTVLYIQSYFIDQVKKIGSTTNYTEYEYEKNKPNYVNDVFPY